MSDSTNDSSERKRQIELLRSRIAKIDSDIELETQNLMRKSGLAKFLGAQQRIHELERSKDSPVAELKRLVEQIGEASS